MWISWETQDQISVLRIKPSLQSCFSGSAPPAPLFAEPSDRAQGRLEHRELVQELYLPFQHSDSSHRHVFIKTSGPTGTVMSPVMSPCCNLWFCHKVMRQVGKRGEGSHLYVWEYPVATDRKFSNEKNQHQFNISPDRPSSDAGNYQELCSRTGFPILVYHILHLKYRFWDLLQ